jgi:hypothetical protein
MREAGLIIHINSYPGVGKLTIGRHLAELLNGKLYDNHSIYNVAFAVTEFRTPTFYETVRAVRDIAYARLRELRGDHAGRSDQLVFAGFRLGRGELR